MSLQTLVGIGEKAQEKSQEKTQVYQNLALDENGEELQTYREIEKVVNEEKVESSKELQRIEVVDQSVIVETEHDYAEVERNFVDTAAEKAANSGIRNEVPENVTEG